MRSQWLIFFERFQVNKAEEEKTPAIGSATPRSQPLNTLLGGLAIRVDGFAIQGRGSEV